MREIKADKQFLIVFPDVHLAYSPSTLNLFYLLKKYFDVELVAGEPAPYFSDQKIIDAGISYLDFNQKRNLNSMLEAIYFKISGLLSRPTERSLIRRRLNSYKTKTIIAYLKKNKKEIIAVDFLALWCAQQAGKKAHFLSLELNQHNDYFDNINVSNILSVIIQSHERLNHLFPNEKPKFFIVQNAPKSIDFKPPYNQRPKTELIYCGSAVLEFGIITCIEFIKDYEEYTLTIKGALPKETEQVINEFYLDLLNENRLIIDTDYLSDAELTRYVAKFRIGFAFYDFYRFSRLRNFNYYTAPSGKVFQYLNSGVPVIANALPAFQFIESGKCGKLISHLSSKQIKLAIDAIEDDYLLFAENAKSESYAYDFEEMIRPFISFLKK